MKKLKVEAIVKFNNGIALVLNRKMSFSYRRVSNSGILGEDEGFYSSYIYEAPTRYYQAFGGIEFDLPLEDGEVVHCNGQWWDGRVKEVKDSISVTVSSVDELTNCYVFSGCYCNKDFFDKLVSEYTGKIYEYREYENEVIKPIKENIRNEYLQSLYMDIIESGFRSLGKWKFECEKFYLKRVDTNYFCWKKNFLANDFIGLDKIFGDRLDFVALKEDRIYVRLKKYSTNFWLIER